MDKRLFLFIFFFSCLTSAQTKKDIIGVWIKMKVETYAQKQNTSTIERDQEFVKYTFEKEGNLFISLVHNEKGNLLKYKIKGDIIDLGYNKSRIEKLSKNELVLVEFEDGRIRSSSPRISFLKEQNFLDDLPISEEDIFTYKNNTVYLESDKIYPKFKSKKWVDIKDYIQPNVEGLNNGMEAFSFSTFIIDEKGKIDDIRIHHRINRDYDRELRRSIEKTSGMWIPPFINGKKVKVLKKVSFHYIRFPKFTSDGEKLTIHPKAEIEDDYLSSYKEAVREYYKGNLLKGLEILEEYTDRESDFPNVTLLKSKIYKRLNDSLNYQRTNNKVQNSRLKYVLEEDN